MDPRGLHSGYSKAMLEKPFRVRSWGTTQEPLIYSWRRTSIEVLKSIRGTKRNVIGMTWTNRDYSGRVMSQEMGKQEP